ncbi:alpha/beta hydrolase [Rhodobacteraceae bacterium NNCM2]|nr:alpha/beta hydrolase [Coraliihabitans acroporae]
MNLPPWLLNAALRIFMRLPLSRIKSHIVLRRRFQRDAKLIFEIPKGASFGRDNFRGADDRLMPALWASIGRPDRKRVILFLHGGAYLVGSPETHKHIAAALAGAAGMRAFIPAYRLAPEAPFPAAVEDALAAYRHLLADNDPSQIAVAGDSAGGGLMFALLLAAQQAGLPPPAAAVAFSPFTDLTLSAPSIKRNARLEAMLPPQRAQECVDNYLQGADPRNPLASPVYGTFENAPPTLILASTIELLADNSTMMAETLRRSGGDVQLEIWPGLPHAWPLFIGWLRAADRAVELAGGFIRDRMDQTG